MMTKHQTVMVVDPGPQPHSNGVYFTNYDPEAEDDQGYSELFLDPELWSQMGQPETITVSVVPGDLLNDKTEASS